MKKLPLFVYLLTLLVLNACQNDLADNTIKR